MASYRLLKVFLFVSYVVSYALGDDNISRVESGVDESSCICGLSNDLLDRLEMVFHQAASDCSGIIAGGNSIGPISVDGAGVTNLSGPEVSPPTISASLGYETPKVPSDISENGSPSTNTETTQLMMNYLIKLNEEIHKLQNQLVLMVQKTDPASVSNVQLGVESLNRPVITSGLQTSLPENSNSIREEHGHDSEHENDDHAKGGDHNLNPIEIIQTGAQTLTHQVNNPNLNGAFLSGLSSSTNNEALLLLNQSQKVEPQIMTTALQSTVPNVVSSIFTDIQTFHNQAGHNKGDSQVGSHLISIDGSSVEVPKDDTSAQITASGEKLFIQWIEHQIAGLHLAASLANRIRVASLNLFRRIVKQYVRRIERMGGNITENVRRATQLALSNTQTLVTFILKNYINFAAGIMQIIGEQVSRVGKQIDTTGENIAQMSLNPLNIVANVIDSLPNPNDYSKYFRAFGNKIINELNGSSSYNSSQVTETSIDNNAQAQNTTDTTHHTGLILKTMGALSKTLSAWIG